MKQGVVNLCCIALISILLNSVVFATPLQIFHTNDLHGFFENTIQDESIGGYAALKTVIDEQKSLAEKNKLDSLLLDAGDFLEGSLFYMAKGGSQTFNMMSLMGYDAVVMGNHDYLMGTDKLEELLAQNTPHFQFLGANLELDDEEQYPNIHHKLKPYAIFERSGVRIGIIGLTTDEVIYRWRFFNGKIESPIKVADKLAKNLKKNDGVDIVIALTHLGVKADQELAKKSKYIDLIVGGHSHTTLLTPIFEKNKRGLQVPIVQAGAHARFLGKLTVDVEQKSGLKLLDYKLIPITNTTIHQDPQISEFIEVSKDQLYKQYGKAWLETIVGEAKIELVSSDSEFTPWTGFISSSLKEAVHTQIGFHFPSFAGATLPIGKVDREKLFNAYPRVFDFEDRFGWFIYTAEVKGYLVKTVLKTLLSYGQVISFAGVTFDIIEEKDYVTMNEKSFWDCFSKESTPPIDLWFNFGFFNTDNFRVENIKVNGEDIDRCEDYSIAFPEGVIKGAIEITSAYKYLFHNIEKTPRTIWGALESKFRRVKVIDEDYVDPNFQSKSMRSQRSNHFRTQDDDHTFIRLK